MAVHVQGACENDVINVGSDAEMSILDLARTVIRVTGSASAIEYLPPLLEGDMSRRCPDVAKMRALLKRPLLSLEDGICRLADHYRSEHAQPAAGKTPQRKARVSKS